jgi:hypothetical protein
VIICVCAQFLNAMELSKETAKRSQRISSREEREWENG